MEAITVMKRYEMKFILNKAQLIAFKNALDGHMVVDEYGKTSIASIYYDTPNYQLIRTSLEKPAYKEKIRLRGYGLLNEDDDSFLELKRKVEGVVYKRRIKIKEENAINFLKGKTDRLESSNQIAKELVYFRNYYQKLEPKIMVIYDRTSYKELDGDIRLTIDECPRYRTYDLNLHTSMDGELLLPPGNAILEIKVQQDMPLWLVNILSENKIYKSSFSKVGMAYQLISKKQLLHLERGNHYEVTI
ncbi:MAG: polyphosphate polymerase domain-containing protein [Bacilli bacterium]|nr:polyphosphate polymerase domain-containing protein [Bacilli bacterium]